MSWKADAEPCAALGLNDFIENQRAFVFSFVYFGFPVVCSKQCVLLNLNLFISLKNTNRLEPVFDQNKGPPPPKKREKEPNFYLHVYEVVRVELLPPDPEA